MIGESIEIILLFGVIGLITNWIAWSKGFYHLPKSQPVLLPGKFVVGVFAIYLAIMMIVAPGSAGF